MYRQKIAPEAHRLSPHIGSCRRTLPVLAPGLGLSRIFLSKRLLPARNTFFEVKTVGRAANPVGASWSAADHDAATLIKELVI
jgi:hypothetical protein